MTDFSAMTTAVWDSVRSGYPRALVIAGGVLAIISGIVAIDDFRSILRRFFRRKSARVPNSIVRPTGKEIAKYGRSGLTLGLLLVALGLGVSNRTNYTDLRGYPHLGFDGPSVRVSFEMLEAVGRQAVNQQDDGLQAQDLEVFWLLAEVSNPKLIPHRGIGTSQEEQVRLIEQWIKFHE